MKKCLHCQEPSASEDFCCWGCQTAYHLIQGAGLQAVYQRSERLWKPPHGGIEPAFKIFENQDFLDKRAPLGKDGFRRIDLQIEGLMCSSCIWVVERLPHFISDVVESRVDYGSSRLSLKFKDGPMVLSRSAEILAKLGYKLDPSELDLSSSRIPKGEWIRLGISGLSAAGAMHIGLLLLGSHGTDLDPENARLVGFFAGIAALPALTYGAWPFFRSAWQVMKLGRLSSDLLVSLAVVLGFTMSAINAADGKAESYFDALAMIVFLLLGGRVLVRMAMLKTIKKTLWWARRNGELIPASTLSEGDRIEVEAGEIVPVDSSLETKSAWFDLSHVSGESAPVPLIEGQTLLQGSIARSHAKLRVKKDLSKSYLESLSHSLDQPQWQSIHPRVETVFTATILLMALGVLWFVSIDGVSKALALLIVTCPCALQLAYPLGVTFLRSAAQKAGILIFNPHRVLQWGSVTEIHFDKTGTLTQGSPKLVKVQSMAKVDLTEEELNGILMALASNSSHPLSKTLAYDCAEKSFSPLQLENLKEIPGFGLTGNYKNEIVSLKRAEGSQGMETSLFLADRELRRFSFADTIRPEAREALDRLHREGLQLNLLSGDHQEECNRFVQSSAISFDGVHGGLDPEAKMQAQGPSTAFVGDGLNDAKAMRAAQTSIGFSGSAEANLQSADAYLLNRNLNLVSELRTLAMRCRNRINLNLGISLIYNILTMGLVLGGHLGPIVCAIFMPLSSLTVLFIAYRPLRLSALDS